MPPTVVLEKRLPSLIDVRHLLTMLFGFETVCKPRKEPLPPIECVVIAAYKDNNGMTRRLLTCDLAFANSAGAALSAIPPSAANKATKDGDVSENVLANLSEVMNVAVNLFTDSFGARLELASVSLVCDSTMSSRDCLSAASRLKLEIAIPRYDVGRVDLIAV